MDPNYYLTATPEYQLRSDRLLDDLRERKARVKYTRASFAGADLSRLDLRGKTFEKCSFRGANLDFTSLQGATLREVDFTDASLRRTNFYKAHIELSRFDGASCPDTKFTEAKVTYSTFLGTDLARAVFLHAAVSDSSLAEANLDSVDFSHTHLNNVRLDQAFFSGAIFHGTYLVRCVGLELGIALDETQHGDKSFFDLPTLRNSIRELPYEFLTGIGLTIHEIETLTALYTSGIQFHSCFLAHADADTPFAERLRRDLVAHGVSCWHYRYDMRAGLFWRSQVETAIHLHDKLVLICSENCLKRPNLAGEVIAAMGRERDSGQKKLFPIRIDDFILGDDALHIADRIVGTGEWSEDWVRYIRRFHIPDFSGWQDKKIYSNCLRSLLRDLRALDKSGTPVSSV